MCSHQAFLPCGLNICVSTSQLHNVHHPRDPGVVCPQDSVHIDWLTIPGGKIDNLLHAWRLDYYHEHRPMRILLSAGLNDLVQGGTKDTLMSAIRHFKEVVDSQNRNHPRAKNEFAVATLINPPKLVWYPDNGPPPAGHHNRLQEIKELNDDIIKFNCENNMFYAPRFQMLGVRKTKKWFADGSFSNFKSHRWEAWRATEPVHDKLHLSDQLRVRMARGVVRYFQGEVERGAGPVAEY